MNSINTTSSPAAKFVAMANRFARASAFIFNYPAFEQTRFAAKLEANTTELAARLGDNPTPRAFEQVEADSHIFENHVREVTKMKLIFLDLSTAAIEIYRYHPSEELLTAIELNVELLKEDY